jgi:uncharacterized protein YceK
MCGGPIRLLLLAVVVTLSGCGTIVNDCYYLRQEGGGQVYGGVKVDAEVAGEKAIEAVRPGDVTERLRAGVAALALAADLPLSLVGDTLSLPWTLGLTLGRAFIDDPSFPPDPEWVHFWDIDGPQDLPGRHRYDSAVIADMPD